MRVLDIDFTILINVTSAVNFHSAKRKNSDSRKKVEQREGQSSGHVHGADTTSATNTET